MGIYQPEGSLGYVETCCCSQFLKMLDSHPASLDIQKLVGATLGVAAQPNEHTIDNIRQQMNVWQLRNQTLDYLLMAPERHLPSRETDENNSSLSKELFGMGEELLLLLGRNMFDNIVHQYDIITLCLV